MATTQKRKAKVASEPGTTAFTTTFTREQLVTVLAEVKAVAARPSTPILANVSLTVSEGVATFVATDLQMTLRVQVPYDKGKHCNGQCLVPLKLLEIAQKAPMGDLTLTAHKKGDRHWLSITDAAGGEYEIECGNPSEFPADESEQPAAIMILSAEALKRAMQATAMIAATSHPQEVLCSVQMKVNPTEKRLNCVSSDGFRFVSSHVAGQLKINPKQSIPEAFLFPTRAAREILATLERIDGLTEVKIRQSSQNSILEFSDGEGFVKQIICRCISQPYPSIPKNVTDFEPTLTALLNRNDLLAKLERLSIFEAGASVLIALTPDQPLVSITLDTASARGQQTVGAENIEGSALKVLINLGLLLEVIRFVKSKVVEIQLLNPNHPVKIRGIAGDEDEPVEETVFYIAPLGSKKN
jgi:DNA polymerase III subunit beta